LTLTVADKYSILKKLTRKESYEFYELRVDDRK
jgi:hypothetical protein